MHLHPLVHSLNDKVLTTIRDAQGARECGLSENELIALSDELGLEYERFGVEAAKVQALLEELKTHIHLLEEVDDLGKP